MILFLIFFFKFDKKPEPHDTNITNHYNQLKMSYKSNAPTGRLAIIDYEKCQPIAKIDKSYFVGGSWGSTTEKKMMKEILRNGAINGDF